MQRDLRRLADSTFDLLVVGAGIYGALAAWDAAQRGLRVALIDRGDFGAGTSFNSHKTLHGGLRSLQALSLPQMRLFIRERRAMARMMPHLLRPLPFCVPTSSRLTRSRLALRTALAVSDAVGRDRNDGVDDEGLRLPGGRIVSRDECLALNPLVDPAGVTGGAVWFDYQMRQTERVTLSAVLSAVAGGAAAANYVEALALLRDGATVIGASVEDRRTGQRFDIRASVVINAAGPWAATTVARLLGAAVRPPAAQLSRAMNLVIDRVTGTHACGGSVEGRFLFAVPWRDVSIVGTSHDLHDGGPEAVHGTAADVAALLGDAQRAFPRAGLSASSVRLVHRGLLPMAGGTGSRVALIKESQIVDHAGDGHPGLISIVSVRYTTARHTAEAAVDAVSKRIGRATRGTTATSRVASAGFDSVAHLLDQARTTEVPGTTPALRERLAGSYGTDWRQVAALAAERTGLGDPLAEGCTVTGAEILHAVRHEAAITLGDAVLRRTEAGTAGHPGRGALEAAAAIIAGTLGWDTARVAAEIADVEAVYPAGDGSA
jgi:glycerol-3-phosphate dehydrogenase